MSNFPDFFPENACEQNMIAHELARQHSLLSARRLQYNLGLLYTPVQAEVTDVFRVFLEFNPNHLGNWSLPTSRPYATQEMERQLIVQMGDLFGARNVAISGYVTTGATEGILYMAWLSRRFFDTMSPTTPVCLLGTDLSHYSVRKAASVTGMVFCSVPLCVKSWTMSGEGLRATIQRERALGRTAFVLVATLGYTVTGTSDDLARITGEVQKIENQFPDVKILVIVDAAINGLVQPFLQKNFSLFSSASVLGVVTDFHKFAGVPYGAGVVVVRNEYGNGQDIDYLEQVDATLLGSRQGAVVPAVWARVQSLGRSGFKKMVSEMCEKKQYFIKNLQQRVPQFSVVHDGDGVACAIYNKEFPVKKIPEWIERKYWLYAKSVPYNFVDGVRVVCLYKCYFLPHVSKVVLDEFLADLESLRGDDTVVTIQNNEAG